MQTNKAGLFRFFLAAIMYTKAAIMIMKNFIMKLPYNEPTDDRGLAELSECCET